MDICNSLLLTSATWGAHSREGRRWRHRARALLEWVFWISGTGLIASAKCLGCKGANYYGVLGPRRNGVDRPTAVESSSGRLTRGTKHAGPTIFTYKIASNRHQEACFQLSCRGGGTVCMIKGRAWCVRSSECEGHFSQTS